MTDPNDKRGSASPEGEGREPAFRVIDRRRFDADGEERAEPAIPVAEAPRAEAPESPAAGDQGFVMRDRPEEAAPPAPEANISALFLGLSTQALMHLGEIPDPDSGESRQDLPSARGLIDLLAVLREKTQGNLDAEESRLLDRILYDLRMRFVEIARSS